MKKRKQRARPTRRVHNLYVHVLTGSSSIMSYMHYRIQDVSVARQIMALTFAREWGGRSGIDVKRLEGIVVRGPVPEVIARYAKEVPGANLRRITRAVVRTGDVRAMRVLAGVPGVDRAYLENAIVVAEVMAV